MTIGVEFHLSRGGGGGGGGACKFSRTSYYEMDIKALSEQTIQCMR